MRYFIYVNHNVGTEHITIHCERHKHCPEILKRAKEEFYEIPLNFKKINAETKAFKIITITKETDRESKNGYWILLWAKEGFCENYLENEIIEMIADKHSIPQDKIKLCQKCS